MLEIHDGAGLTYAYKDFRFSIVLASYSMNGKDLRRFEALRLW